MKLFGWTPQELWRRRVLCATLAAMIAASMGYAIGQKGFYGAALVVGKAMDSAFGVGVIGAAFSSYMGAYAAQWIVERKNLKAEIQKDLKYTDIAIMTAVSKFNTMVTVYKQHVIDLHRDYHRQLNGLLAHREKFANKVLKPGEVYEFQANYQTLQISPFSAELLKSQITEKIFITGRPFLLSMVLAETAASLTVSIARRNHLIETMKMTHATTSDEYKLLMYFGLTDKNGRTDRNYPDSIDAIYRQTQDGIVFSMLIIQDLVASSDQIRGRLLKEFKEFPAKLVKPDFDQMRQEGLIPDLGDYAIWIDMGKERQTS